MSEHVLCCFVASLGREDLAPSTIKTYLAAVRHAQIMRGFPEPRESSSLPRLRLLLAGVKRVRAEQGQGTGRRRRPITPKILQQIRGVWNSRAADPDTTMLWAAVTTCFFGFFRAGEITVPSAAAFNPAVHLAWGDVAINNPRNPTLVVIHLKRSKCDQFGDGVDVCVGRTGDELCPVVAITSYIVRRGGEPGAFFRTTEGRPLTKALFVKSVQRALQEAGVRSDVYTGHSFRIRAATTAARAGLQDFTIQMLGRWSSAAFLSYIRVQPEQVAGVSRVLAGH